MKSTFFNTSVSDGTYCWLQIDFALFKCRCVWASESHKHQMISDNSTRWTVYMRQMTEITQESNICNWLLLYMQGHEVQSNDWRLTRLQLDAANKWHNKIWDAFLIILEALSVELQFSGSPMRWIIPIVHNWTCFSFLKMLRYST